MLTSQKRLPVLTDLDTMPFGEHKNKPMQDVPAKYLAWIWEQPWLEKKYIKVYNYIFNNKEAIELELGEKI